MADRSNVSTDLVWEVVRSQNAFLVQRNSGGGVRFSRDPMNLRNKHSRTHAGFIHEKAVGVQPGPNGGVVMTTKKSSKNSNRPVSSTNSVSWGKSAGNRKIYKGIANHTAKGSYRADLRGDAVSRASNIKASQRPKKDTPEKKLRGSKAKKASEKA